MQIHHNGKTYTVIEKDLKYYLDKCVPEWIKSGYFIEHRGKCLHSEFCCDECYNFDKAMELVEETKPTYWYIERIEMMQENYWNIFQEWYSENANWKPDFKAKNYGFYNGVWTVGDYGQQKLSPQQWYDTIYDGEKIAWDKLNEKQDREFEGVEEKIELLPTYKALKEPTLFTDLEETRMQVERLTDAVNKLILLSNK